MNKNKKNTVLFILLIIILFVLIIDFCLFFQNKKINQHNEQQTNSEDAIIELEKRVSCHNENHEFINDEVDIKYQVMDDYTFYVDKNNTMIPDHYITLLTFDNLKDLNIYYDYAINKLNLIYSPNYKLEKKDENFTISYSRSIIQGGYEYFEDEYLEILKKIGYTCEVENLGFSLMK